MTLPKNPIARLVRLAFISLLSLVATSGGYVWWYLLSIEQLSIDDRLRTVPSDAGSTAADPISTLVNAANKHDVLLLGEEHRNFLQARRLVTLLEAVEASTPGRIGLIGLEVFSRYQDRIDMFLQSGDEQLLRNTPDEEALRGHKGEEEITKNFLEIYRTVRAINGQRKNLPPIRIIAMDSAPAEATFRTWWRSSGKLERSRWVVSRDEAMADRIEKALLDVKSARQMAIIFVGSAHIQRSGKVILGIPPAKIEVEWFGTRIAKKFDLLAINLNDPHNDCVDVIEAWMLNQRNEAASETLIDLRRDSLGRVAAFRCNDEFPLPFQFVPRLYVARDHYDLYWHYKK